MAVTVEGVNIIHKHGYVHGYFYKSKLEKIYRRIEK